MRVLNSVERMYVDVLDRACDLMRKGWTRDHTAATKQNQPCRYNSRAAERFSLPGALSRAELDLHIKVREHGETTRFLGKHFESLSKFNQNAQSAREVIERIERIRERLAGPRRRR